MASPKWSLILILALISTLLIISTSATILNPTTTEKTTTNQNFFNSDETTTKKTTTTSTENQIFFNSDDLDLNSLHLDLELSPQIQNHNNINSLQSLLQSHLPSVSFLQNNNNQNNQNNFQFRSSFNDMLSECQGELQCWLNNLQFNLPTLPFNISGILGNMTNFECSQINLDHLTSGLNPPPYPEPNDVSEFHMGVINAGLVCKGTFYYNMTFFPYLADFANFTATVNQTDLGVQVYVESNDGFKATGTRQGDCSMVTNIDLQFEGSVSAFILELIKKPLIDMMKNLIQDNFCLITQDIINNTITSLIKDLNKLLEPVLLPHKPLPPVSPDAKSKSTPFADLQIFQFLDKILNGDPDGKSSGIFTNPDPLNCIVGLFTNHTGEMNIPTYNATDPGAFMPNITLSLPDLGNITIGLPSILIQNLNTISSMKLLHGLNGDDSDGFTFNNDVELARLKVFLHISMIIDLNETISKLPLNESFLFMIDMNKPSLGLDIRSVVDRARLHLAKLGGFCQADSLLPCLLSLFQGTWSGNGGLQLSKLGLNAKFAMGILPLEPNDSPLEKDLDLLLNNLAMSLADKFSPMLTRLIYGISDNILRDILNDVLITTGEGATTQCNNATPEWDGKSNTPLIWHNTIIYRLFHFIIHDVLQGVNGINDFIECSWDGGSVGPEHDFDTIIIPDQDLVVQQWWEHWTAFNKTYNITTAPLFQVFNNTMRGLNSVSRMEFFEPIPNNETHVDNDYRLSGEIGFGKASNEQNCQYNQFNEMCEDDSRIDSKKIYKNYKNQIENLKNLEKFKIAEIASEHFLDEVLKNFFFENHSTNENIRSTLTMTEREELYGEYIQNMMNLRENTVKYLEKLEAFKLKNAEKNTIEKNFIETKFVENDVQENTKMKKNDGINDDDDDDIMDLIQQYLIETKPTSASETVIVEQEKLTIDALLRKFIENGQNNDKNGQNSSENHQNGQNSSDNRQNGQNNDELVAKFIEMLNHLNTALPSNAVETSITTVTFMNNNDDLDDLDNQDENLLDLDDLHDNDDGIIHKNDKKNNKKVNKNAGLRWGLINNKNNNNNDDGCGSITNKLDHFTVDPEPEPPQGPLKIWLAMAVPVSRRYLIVNTTIIVDSFETDGIAFLQVNKDKLYDLTIAKTFSLCLPSVFDKFIFESFNGHIKALTLVIDLLMDPRAKLFHKHATGKEFVDEINRVFENEALPAIANMTSTLFETLLWASTYACKDLPIPGAPKIVDNLRHSIVEWLAVAIPGGRFKNWNRFFCRAGRGSSKGHVVMSNSNINQQANQIESLYIRSNNNSGAIGGIGGGGIDPSSGGESFKVKASTPGGTHVMESTVKLANNTNNNSLPLAIDDDDFIEDYHPITLPVQPAYGMLNLGSINGYEAADESGSYQPPHIIGVSSSAQSSSQKKKKNNKNRKQENIPETSPVSMISNNSPTHKQNPDVFDEPTDQAALINLNTLSLESGLSIDTLTGSSLLHSPTLPLLLRIGMLIALITNALLFLVSNMSNGAAVTVIISLFGTEYDLGTVFNFTLISTIEDMWVARVYVLFILIGAFSGFLPYFKVFLMMVAWCLPTHKLSIQWREFILIWLDRLGKFSLLDAFVFVLMFVAFRMHLPILGNNVIVDSIVRADPGFYFFLLATMMSMGLSHISLALHRHSLTPYVVEKGGPVRSLRQHYHTLFIIDQSSPNYSQNQADLLQNLPECQEYNEILQQRREKRQLEDERYKNNLEKLGYTSVSVTSLDPYNAGLNSISEFPTSQSTLTTSESSVSMFEQVDPMTGQPICPSNRSFGMNNRSKSGSDKITNGENKQKFAIKLRLSLSGSILTVIALITTLVVLLYGIFIDTFRFRFGGISGWLLGEAYDSNDWSIWTVGENITISSRDPTSIGIHWVQLTYFVFAIFMPILFLFLMIFIFIYPLTLKTHKALHVLVEILFAWSGVDVFIISILAAVLQISQLAESLVGDKCDFLLPFLEDYMHDALEGHDKCFVVLAQYKLGAVFLIIAAILILLMGVATITLSASALTDRTNKYFRLIQYSLYQRQLRDGTLETRLIPFHADKSSSLASNNASVNGLDQSPLITNANTYGDAGIGAVGAGGIVTSNSKNSSIIKTVQTISQTQNAHTAPIDRIPSWFGLVSALSRLGLVELSRTETIEDVFGWTKDNVREFEWSQEEVDSSINDSTISMTTPNSSNQPSYTSLSQQSSPKMMVSSVKQKSPSKKDGMIIGSIKKNKKIKKIAIGADDDDSNDNYIFSQSDNNSIHEPSLTTTGRRDSYSQSHLEPM